VTATPPDSDVEALRWCLLPALDTPIRDGRASVGVREWARAQRDRWLRPTQSYVGISAALGGIVAWGGANATPRRVLTPVVGDDEKPLPFEVGRVPAAAQGAVAEIREWGSEILRSRGRSDAIPRWNVQVRDCAEMLFRFRAFDFSPFRFLFLAQTANPPIRAVMLAARERELPVVGITHAPLSERFLDLPVGYGGLRGAEEVRYHVELGADPTHLSIVGYPDADLVGQPIPEPSDASPGVLALSEYPARILERTFELIRSAGVGRLIVAPHPRSNVEHLRRILPPDWTLHTGGRTLDLLKAGPPFVIQSSSGVAWESAVLGIPTAELRAAPGTMDGQYLFLRDESTFPVLESSDDVRDFVRRATLRGFDRRELRDHALAWCDVDGEESVRRIRAMLDSVEPHVQPSRILDGWAPGGPARERLAAAGAAL
jgi:hypothetical protein